MGWERAKRFDWRAIAAAVLAAAALIVAPSQAAAATSCELSSGVLDVTMSASADTAAIGPTAGTIFIADANGTLVACAGPTPTVTNTSVISVHNGSGMFGNLVQIFRASDLAPGASVETAENGGTPEIEVFVNLNNGDGGELQIISTTAGANMTFGNGGVNPNSDFGEVQADADIFANNVPILHGIGNSGADFISAAGGAGTGPPLSTQGVLLSGGGGNDNLTGGQHPDGDGIYGESGDDRLDGLGGADVVDGGPGQNIQLFGGEGNDRLIAGSPNDFMNGGPGSDLAMYSNVASGVEVDMEGSSASIENLSGSPFADVFLGDAGPNLMTGNGGNDVLVGGAGEDSLSGGAGEDSLDVRDAGPDGADCGADADTVTADAPGVDTLAGCETTLFPEVDGGGAPPPGADSVAPAFIGKPTANPRRFRVDRSGAPETPVREKRSGTTLGFRLSEAATVTFAVERRTAGRRRFKPVGAFRSDGLAGANSKRFSGRIGGRRLHPGVHRIVLTAVDSAANKSQPTRLKFKVLKAR